MTLSTTQRVGVLATAAFFAVALSAGKGLTAGDPDGTRGPTSQPKSDKSDPKSSDQNKKKKKSSQIDELHQRYLAARALILEGRYAEGIAALQALHSDDDAEVANYIGFANRKLGNFELAKVWYERALSTDPNHTRTLQYYGMWQLETGNMLKAEDFLEKIRAICGSAECADYVLLKRAIDTNVTY